MLKNKPREVGQIVTRLIEMKSTRFIKYFALHILFMFPESGFESYILTFQITLAVALLTSLVPDPFVFIVLGSGQQ